MSASGATLMHFSTDDFPERDRIQIWGELFGRAILKTSFRPVAGRPFRQVGVICGIENLGVAFGETNGLLSRRDKERLVDGNDDLVLHTNLSGVSLISQRGRELRLADGEAVLLACGEVLSHDFPQPGRSLAVRVPRHALSNVVADPEGALMRPLSTNNPAFRLLIDYVGLIARQNELTPGLQRAFVTHVHDLVALTLGATREAAEAARSRGLRAARLNAIRTDVIDHIGDQSLSVTDIARRHRVTPRYVQMLFEAEGGTFTEFVIGQRLVLVHRRLVDPRFADRTISAIAFEAGFANLSYFNRVFRRCYSASPSEVREAAGRQRGE